MKSIWIVSNLAASLKSTDFTDQGSTIPSAASNTFAVISDPRHHVEYDARIPTQNSREAKVSTRELWAFKVWQQSGSLCDPLKGSPLMTKNLLKSKLLTP
ncbi:MAG: hypothetical protein IPJ28_14805 [Betaproteobacteria bacterium]|nr:hypothetical protein [Betaproteobacteria bacterium]